MATAASPVRVIEYERPWVYEKQRKAIFNSHRISIIEASTKSGKTVGCIIWLLEQAMKGKSGHNFWWVAPSYGVAKIAYRRMKRAIPRDLYSANETELFLHLVNDTYIWFKGGDKPDLLYGEDVHAAVIDEATRVKEESWHAIRSTLTFTRGMLRIIGNVKGRKNWVYRLGLKAKSGKEGMHYAKITAYDAVDAGVLDAQEIEDAKSVLPDFIFNELYKAEPAEDGGNPFGLQHIEACVSPLSSLPPVAWGWDLGKSQDFTVGIGLDEFGAVCRFERFQISWNDTFKRIKALTNGVPALVDSTGVGDPIVEGLQRGQTILMESDEEEFDPGTLEYIKTETERLLGGSNFEGFKFSTGSKQQIMEGLAVAVQSHATTILEGTHRNEMESFEYEYSKRGVRYTAPEGMFDDCVCAHALAWHKLFRKDPAPDVF